MRMDAFDFRSHFVCAFSKARDAPQTFFELNAVSEIDARLDFHLFDSIKAMAAFDDILHGFFVHAEIRADLQNGRHVFVQLLFERQGEDDGIGCARNLVVVLLFAKVTVADNGRMGVSMSLDAFCRTAVGPPGESDVLVLVDDVEEHPPNFSFRSVCRFRNGFDGCILVFGWNLLGLDVDVFLEVVACQKLVVNRVDATTCAFHALDALAVRLRLLFEFRMPQDQQLIAVDGDADQHDGEHRHDREAADADGETLVSGRFGLL